MRIARPKSVLGLILVGFALVALPLIVGILRAANYVESLTARNEQLVLQGLHVGRTTEELTEQITDLERNARQYQALGDTDLLSLYEERHTRFLLSLRTLDALDVDDRFAAPLDHLREEGNGLFEVVRTDAPGSPSFEAALVRYGILRDLAYEIAAGSTRFVDGQLEELQLEGERARRSLFWQSATLIPMALILVVVFTTLIARPIRQVARAIHRLGEGNLATPISITGPPDLTDVGDELDWLRRRLYALEQEKNSFLRQMSHELKTPLASIREGAELLVDGTLGRLDDTQVEVVDILRDSAKELEQLIENLLSFSAWQESKSQLNLSELDVGRLCESVLQNHRLGVVRKQLVVHKSIAPVVIDGDRDKLRMTLDNIVSNAVKYSPPHGTIEIDVDSQQDLAVIEVGDGGPGVSAQDRAHIFDPFYQGSTSQGARQRGTGIGLTVARECVEAHGGSIELVDQGTTGARFRICIPKVRNARAA